MHDHQFFRGPLERQREDQAEGLVGRSALCNARIDEVRGHEHDALVGSRHGQLFAFLDAAHVEETGATGAHKVQTPPLGVVEVQKPHTPLVLDEVVGRGKILVHGEGAPKPGPEIQQLGRRRGGAGEHVRTELLVHDGLVRAIEKGRNLGVGDAAVAIQIRCSV